jgi:hypothetical protein
MKRRSDVGVLWEREREGASWSKVVGVASGVGGGSERKKLLDNKGISTFPHESEWIENINTFLWRLLAWTHQRSCCSLDNYNCLFVQRFSRSFNFSINKRSIEA